MSFRYFDQKYGFELRRKTYRRLEILSPLLQSALWDIKKILLHLFFFPFYAVRAEKELDSNDPRFINALEEDNRKLEKRIAAFKSNIMMVTSFDKITTTV